MPKGRIKQDAASIPVPQSREEAIEAIAEIGRCQRERDRIESIMNDALAQVRQRFEEEAAPYAEVIKRLSAGVHLWAEANRQELTREGKVKYARLASGEIKWRLTPPSVVVRGVETVLQILKDMRLHRFIRLKEEVNKEAILLDPEAVKHVPGISIRQKEEFVIQPFETELEEVA